MKTDDELMLALHDMLEGVEKDRATNAAGAHELLVELLELAAEERGAFLGSLGVFDSVTFRFQFRKVTGKDAQIPLKLL